MEYITDEARLLKIEKLEEKIERNIGQRQVLTRMMAGGYLEPVLFKQKNNALTAESEILQQEKENLIRAVHGDAEKAEELQNLLRFTSKGMKQKRRPSGISLIFIFRDWR